MKYIDGLETLLGCRSVGEVIQLAKGENIGGELSPTSLKTRHFGKVRSERTDSVRSDCSV